MITSRTSAVVAKLLAAAVLPALFVACGDSTPPGSTGSGGSGGTGSTVSSGGTGGGTGGMPSASLTVERWGARIWGPILALSRTDRTLWFGTRTVADPDGAAGVAHGGLGRLDLDTGAVKVFEAELPQVEQGLGPDTFVGAVPTAGVVKDGARHLVVAQTGILVLGDDDKVTEQKIAAPGGDASPTGIVVDRDGGRARIWAATEQGLVRMNADTFAVEKVLGEAEIGSLDIGSLALDPGTGAVYLAVYEENGPGSHVARIDDAGVTTFAPGDGGTPAGTVGNIAWSTKAGAAVIAIGSWDKQNGGVATWNGSAAATLATDAQLSTAARGEAAAFGAMHLTVDDTDGIVIVGGSIQPTGPLGILVGGGLAWIDLKTKGLAGVSTGTSFLPGDDIGALTYDPTTRRTYVADRQPCNETQLGHLGLVAVSFRADGSSRIERPVLSGVRSMAVVGDEVYLGLRDDAPGMSCFGYPVQTGLVRLQANHGGEVVPLQAGPDGDPILPLAGPTAMSVDAQGRFVIGTFRDGTFVGLPTGGYAFNQTTPGVSLYESDAVWSAAGTFWLAGGATHDPTDTPDLADVGPRGAALVTLDADGKPASFKHYVHASKDAKDVTGLPSSEIAALAVAPDGAAYLACATERVSTHPSDRDLGTPFSLNGQIRAGGVAKIGADGAVTVLAGSDVAPDARGVAIDAAGEVWVLDAQKGLLHGKSGALVPASTPDGVPSGAYPHGLWRGADQDLAALYDKGALVSLGGSATFVADAGHAWRATPRAKGMLLVGADQGLIRARMAGTADVPEKAVDPGVLPAFKP